MWCPYYPNQVPKTQSMKIYRAGFPMDSDANVLSERLANSRPNGNTFKPNT